MIYRPNIEVAHAYFTGNSASDFLLGKLHAEKSLEILQSLTFDGKPVISCLIDDQRVKRKHRHRLLPGVLGITSIIDIDFFAYETDLNTYKSLWLNKQKNAARISGDLKRKYVNQLQCSHYIAIWYSLRAGIIKDKRNVLMPVSDRAISSGLSFPNSNILSILPETYKPYEDLAEVSYLDNMTVTKPTVERIYYEWTNHQ